MKVAIMQPYFFPYIGYFQLIAAVDLFVVYDNIKYTKKGWINRNRFLRNGADCTFSVPLKRDSDSLDIRDRFLAESFDRKRLVNQLQEAYRRAPFYTEAFPIVQQAILHSEDNLFGYLLNSLSRTCVFLEIKTPFVRSSTLNVDPALRGQDRVIETCLAVGAGTYINPIGGTALYSSKEFQNRGLALRFLQSRAPEYGQFDHPFVPWLSMIDVMMFNSQDAIHAMLDSGYDLISGPSDLPDGGPDPAATDV